MTTALAEKKKFTYEDYLRTPENERYELLEGDLIMTPAPVTKHQWVSKNILYELEKFLRERKLGKVFDAPYDVQFDEENIVQPDILFVSNERKSIITEKNIQGAPDLIIEILSDSTAYRDLVKKKKLYARFGVKEYWIVDPGEKTAEVFTLKDNLYSLAASYSEGDILKSSLLSGIEITLQDVFKE